MNVLSVSAAEYAQAVSAYGVFFNSPAFAQLNEKKCDEVLYLLLSSGKGVRFALIVGRREDIALCPFSAPYSYPVVCAGSAKMQEIDDALESLELFLVAQGFKGIRFGFPPLLYDEPLLSGWMNSFYRHGYSVAAVDVSYHLDLTSFDADEYYEALPQGARYSLRRAKRADLQVVRCSEQVEYQRAYNVVKANHDSKGRPTHMSFQQLMDTMALVEHDAFLVVQDQHDAAACFVYAVNEMVAQIIYFGHLNDFSQLGATNYLLSEIAQYYHQKGYSVLDYGPATEDSVPNEGLCEFKENAGFSRSLKCAFEKTLTSLEDSEERG